MSSHAADRLLDAIDRAGSPACVGLDPVIERLPPSLRSADPAASIERFCIDVLDALHPLVAAVKPQSACFERYGSPGVAALERVAARAKHFGLFVILDAKRGDIGITAEHYAAFAYDAVGADALTASPYMGFDTLEHLRRPGRALFPLVRTSNPGSDHIQSLRAGQRTIAEHVAHGVAKLGDSSIGTRGYSDLGAVVAATKPQDAAALRRLMPHQIFLVPGFGAQGGSPDTIRDLFTDGHGAIINASRSVLYAFTEEDHDWTAPVRAAAADFAQQVRAAAAAP